WRPRQDVPCLDGLVPVMSARRERRSGLLQHRHCVPAEADRLYAPARGCAETGRGAETGGGAEVASPAHSRESGNPLLTGLLLWQERAVLGVPARTAPRIRPAAPCRHPAWSAAVR